jgi:hypothetical protein
MFPPEYARMHANRVRDKFLRFGIGIAIGILFHLYQRLRRSRSRLRSFMLLFRLSEQQDQTDDGNHSSYNHARDLTAAKMRIFSDANHIRYSRQNQYGDPSYKQ